MENIKTLYVGGTFNDKGGRPSKLAHQVFEEISPQNTDYINGGHYSQLEETLNSVDQYNLIYWFADIPNDKPKLIGDIKKKNKACVLVTSKRNRQNKYHFADLVYHALGNKSNLLVEFSDKEDRYLGRVLDPLGNIFLDHNDDFSLVGKVLNKRANELVHYTREGSTSVGDRITVPNEEEFFALIKEYGSQFHELVHASGDAANRFFGNASFRCERGFPSFRKEGMIYVSQRNVDKRFISQEGFVAVQESTPVQYHGDIKPSVDTPIQVRLFQHYNNLKYMLHGHVYVKDAPFTENVVPCGAIEEADEILTLFPNKNEVNFAVNLRGHGSLVLVDNLENLKDIPYITRSNQELHQNYMEDLQ